MLGGSLGADSGPTTLTLAAFAASFILDIWIFSLLVRSTWSAHLSRRIGRARARALGMRARCIAPGDTLIGGWEGAAWRQSRFGLLGRTSDPYASPFSRYYLDLPVRLERE